MGIWWLSNNSTILGEAKRAIADPDNIVFVSAACYSLLFKKII